MPASPKEPTNMGCEYHYSSLSESLILYRQHFINCLFLNHFPCVFSVKLFFIFFYFKLPGTVGLKFAEAENIPLAVSKPQKRAATEEDLESTEYANLN